MRIVPALVLLSLVLGGCATSGPSTPTGTTPPPSGTTPAPVTPSPTTPSATRPAGGIALSGTVRAAPGCGGPQRAGSPCPDRPVAGAAVELSALGAVVASTRTDAAGRFRFVVPAGTYRVTAHNVGYGSQASVDVVLSAPREVSLVVDSGLR